MSDGLRADECQLGDVWVGSQVVGDIGKAHDALDEVSRVAAAGEGAADDFKEECGGPGCLFRGLHHDSVSGEDRTDDGGDEVVEGIVPGDAGGDYAERLVGDHVLLVHHEEVCRARFGCQCLFTVVEGPFQFLSGDEDLPKCSINFGLS